MKLRIPRNLDAELKSLESALDSVATYLNKIGSQHFNDMKKIKLNKNEKIPIRGCSWKDSRYQFKDINPSYFNIGVPTGKINNIFVVDIDIKKEHKKELDGVSKINEYICTHGEIDTLTVQTPSGGTHYYFRYDGNNEDVKYIVKHHLYTRSGIGGYSIDIRSDNGYATMPPSSINGNHYNVINCSSISKIPDELASFLKQLDDRQDEVTAKRINQQIRDTIEDELKDDEPNDETEDAERHADRQHKYVLNKHYLGNFVFVMDDAKIFELLGMLPDGFDDDFSKYMTITTILKGHNKFFVWNEWSKRNKSKYNYFKNMKLWNWCKPIYNINILVHVLRKDYEKDVPYINFYKRYEPITTNTFYDEKKEVNDRYVSNIWSYEDFVKHDVHIIKSTTGTGKTTAMCRNIERYMKDNNHVKFLTITSRTTLSDQHIVSFKNINLRSYKDVDNLYTKKALTLCINSLRRLLMDDDEITDYVLYIDEVSSFLEFTHNETLKNCMRDVYYMIIHLVRHCKKVIVSDALIHDNVINLLSCRKVAKQTLYINNSYQKYKGKVALRIRDECEFVKKIYDEIDADIFFLFGCDSNDTITKIFNKCITKYSRLKDKFMLITADTQTKINNASEEFKDKFVFYSPKITYGV